MSPLFQLIVQEVGRIHARIWLVNSIRSAKILYSTFLLQQNWDTTELTPKQERRGLSKIRCKEHRGRPNAQWCQKCGARSPLGIPEKDILPEEIQTIWNIIRGKEKYVTNGRSTHLATNVNDVEQANCSHVEKIRRRRTRVSPIQ